MTHHNEHPEQGKDETFVGNASPERFRDNPMHKGLETLRLGKIAYSIDGDVLENENMYPVFISKSEAGVLDQRYVNEINRLRAMTKRHRPTKLP